MSNAPKLYRGWNIGYDGYSVSPQLTSAIHKIRTLGRSTYAEGFPALN